MKIFWFVTGLNNSWGRLFPSILEVNKRYLYMSNSQHKHHIFLLKSNLMCYTFLIVLFQYVILEQNI
jgi:hypothetical protein